MTNPATSSLGFEELTSTEALKASVSELVGTAIFVLIAVGSVSVAVAGGGVVGVAAAHGFAYAFLVASIGGGRSLGHINPAVSFALIITGQVSLMRGVMYIVAQLIGACIGVLLLRAFVLDDVLAEIAGAGGLAVSGAVSEAWHGMFLEALGTFVLVWTFFAVAVNPRSSSGSVAPLYVGLAVLVVMLFLIPLTGGSLNPARTFGAALFLPGVADGLPGRWDDAWVFYVGPLLGAAAASLSYYMLYLMPGRQASA